MATASQRVEPPRPLMVHSREPEYTEEQVKALIAELEVPFDPTEIVWRVTNTNREKTRGQVIAYCDQRAYTDRLNKLLTIVGWTRRYEITTSANIERGDKQMAKVIVNCSVTLRGLCEHSSTGEEWMDDENAATSAEAQAFKRACSCFGLGRYLYSLPRAWVDLDDRRQPKAPPKLPAWATPKGWRSGLRPTAAPQPTNGKVQTSAPAPDKITVEGRATECKRQENVFWMTLVGEKDQYLCATQQMDLIERLLRVEGKKVELLVSPIKSSKGPAWQIHKVVGVDWKGGAR